MEGEGILLDFCVCSLAQGHVPGLPSGVSRAPMQYRDTYLEKKSLPSLCVSGREPSAEHVSTTRKAECQASPGGLKAAQTRPRQAG